MQYVATIAALRALNPPTTFGNQIAYIRGYSADGDGGEGHFHWDDTSKETDNGGTVLEPNAGGTGRWKRQFSGAVNVLWFGAKGDGSTDDLAAFEAARDAAQGGPGDGKPGILFIPPPSVYYRISAALIFEKPIYVRGSGIYTCRIRGQFAGPVIDFRSGANGSIISDLTVANMLGDGFKWTECPDSKGRDLYACWGIAGKAFHNYGSLILELHACRASTNGVDAWPPEFKSHRPEYGFYLEANTGASTPNKSIISHCEAAGTGTGIYVTKGPHGDVIGAYITAINSTFQGNGIYRKNNVDKNGYGNVYIRNAQMVGFYNCHCEAPRGIDCEALRNNSDARERNPDIRLKQADGFSWMAGVAGYVTITDTLVSGFYSAMVYGFDVDDKSEFPAFIGGFVGVGNTRYLTQPKLNTAVQIAPSYNIRSTGDVRMPSRNLYGTVLSENGQFLRWHDANTPEGFTPYHGAKIAQDTDKLSYKYSCRVTSTGRMPPCNPGTGDNKTCYPGISFDLSEFHQNIVPRSGSSPNDGIGMRLFVNCWIKKPNKNGSQEPKILTDQDFVRTTNFNAENFPDDTWIEISASFPAGNSPTKIIISVGENAPSGNYILVDNVTIGLGFSAPAIYAPAQWEAPRRMYIEDKRIEYRSTAPTSGKWLRGDIVYNSAPSSGGTVGWVCVASGSPGTWKAFGTIEA